MTAAVSVRVEERWTVVIDGEKRIVPPHYLAKWREQAVRETRTVATSNWVAA